MTIDATTDQALREQIAQAIHRASCSCEGHGELPSWYRRAADAVLPVVQAHQEALRDEWCISGGNAENAAYRCRNIPEPGEILCYYCLESAALDQESARLRADLSSLRSAVAQLADQLEARANGPCETGKRREDCAVCQSRWSNLLGAAQDLRSLLPQEGQPEKGAD